MAPEPSVSFGLVSIQIIQHDVDVAAHLSAASDDTGLE
jgi:hypothetical protein